MKNASFLRAVPVIAALGIAGLGSSALAGAGRLGTLPQGSYTCSLAGDAGGEAWREMPEAAFIIGNASSYQAPDGGYGIYLMTGDRIVFTRGPMKGQRFDRVGSASLQKIDADGEKTRVRCVRMASF